MIEGVNHLTLSVHDMEKSFAFYRDVLGFNPVAKWPKGAYFLAGDTWVALVLDEKTRGGELPEYTHIAFTIPQADFEPLSKKIRDSGVKVWQDNWTEGDSIYFLDPNGHKLEIHVGGLESRIKSARAKPWEGLTFFE